MVRLPLMLPAVTVVEVAGCVLILITGTAGSLIVSVNAADVTPSIVSVRFEYVPAAAVLLTQRENTPLFALISMFPCRVTPVGRLATDTAVL